MAIQQTTFTAADYLELKHLVSGGDISKASKVELERFAVILCRPNAYTHFDTSFPQLCETVQTLLIVRMSEEANKEATRISTIALWWRLLFKLLCQFGSCSSMREEPQDIEASPNPPSASARVFHDCKFDHGHPAQHVRPRLCEPCHLLQHSLAG